MNLPCLLLGAVTTSLLFIPDRGHAAEPASAPATFALIVGVNASLDPQIPALRYADDDAARYLDLFRALGARAYVLSRLDANTSRLHPQAPAEALPPRQPELWQTVERLARDIAQARTRGVPSILYVVYAGHGEVQEGAWHLTLEDGRLAGDRMLAEVVTRAGADRGHVIVDACHAHQLAAARGPGGTRRPVRGFVALEQASRLGKVGYVLSASLSGESHEWSGFEAGVFSHEVRSGLYGAADADGDGQVSYLEIAAFVARANQAVVSDRFRPRVLARAPVDGGPLLDLRAQGSRSLTLSGPDSRGHHLLENGTGVRVLDFHGSGTAPVRLVRPAGAGVLYLRRLADGSERAIPPANVPVDVGQLDAAPARAGVRGAAHQAFSQLFGLPFDRATVADWSREALELETRLSETVRLEEHAAARARWTRVAGYGSLALATASAVTATLLARSAHSLRDGAPPLESHRDSVSRNQRIRARNRGAVVLGVGAAVGGIAGAALLFQGRTGLSSAALDLTLQDQGGALAAGWRF